MPKKKASATYSYNDSLKMLAKLQQMAIEEGNINLALKAEELKCKIASLQADREITENNDDITKILVDFTNDNKNSQNTGDICPAASAKQEV